MCTAQHIKNTWPHSASSLSRHHSRTKELSPVKIHLVGSGHSSVAPQMSSHLAELIQFIQVNLLAAQQRTLTCLGSSLSWLLAVQQRTLTYLGWSSSSWLLAAQQWAPTYLASSLSWLLAAQQQSSHLSGLLIVMVTGCTTTELSPIWPPHCHGYWLHNNRALTYLASSLSWLLAAQQQSSHLSGLLIVMVTGCTTAELSPVWPPHCHGYWLHNNRALTYLASSLSWLLAAQQQSSHLSGLLIVMVTGCTTTELSPIWADPHRHGYWLHNKRGPLLLEFILLDLVTVLDAHTKKEYPTCLSSSSSSRSRFWLCTIRRSCACRITGILVSISTVRASSDNSSPSFYGNRIRDH